MQKSEQCLSKPAGRVPWDLLGREVVKLPIMLVTFVLFRSAIVIFNQVVLIFELIKI